MDKFIVRMVEKSADESLEQGQDLYRKYFIATKIYAKHKAVVDASLKEDGYADVIVKK
ncbi:hypothetical protein LJC58_02055 [Lachnospiraceae bacterium OttesenSCG-928-D06]|nr:hypothetical protein [Lachnospiraceae bacterium OttesenSCG-928-D06]